MGHECGQACSQFMAMSALRRACGEASKNSCACGAPQGDGPGRQVLDSASPRGRILLGQVERVEPSAQGM